MHPRMNPAAVDVRSYVSRLLHATFCVEASGLPESVIQNLNTSGGKQIVFRMFVDTNFLFSILALHGSCCRLLQTIRFGTYLWRSSRASASGTNSAGRILAANWLLRSHLFPALWRVLRRRVLIEISHRDRTYDPHIVVQNDQKWKMAFAHDFANLIHRLIFEAVARLSLHHTVHVRCSGKTRGCSLFRALGDGLARICRLHRCWRLAINLSYGLNSGIKMLVLRRVLQLRPTVSVSDTHRKNRQEYRGCAQHHQRKDCFHGERPVLNLAGRIPGGNRQTALSGNEERSLLEHGETRGGWLRGDTG
jgi:hypothetical protein